MRTALKLRPAYLAGALTLAIGIPTVALATGTSFAQSATVMSLNPQHVAYGGLVTVTGTGSPTAAKQRVVLEYAPPRGTFTPVASTTARPDGSFRLRAKLYRSGLLRVTGASTAKAASAATTGTPLTSTSAVQPSPSQAIAVKAKLQVPTSPLNALSGGPVDVRGRLLPGLGHREVVLQGWTGHRWQALARTATRRGGGFDLRFVPGNTGSEQLRVRFGGDASNGRAFARSGGVTTYRQSVASWYNDAGNTACGFHAGMGVANKTLPCGTKVTFLYGGRRVTAVVDDRGPFVAGREWDLNQNTAGALGFGGVATVWSSL
jgi:hypothetical protein